MTRPVSGQADAYATGAGQRFPRAAGIVVPLFSLRGTSDVGSGEILDVIPFIDWMCRWHQRVLQLLPINETAPGEASPYGALSAFAIDPAYISAAHVIDVVRAPAAQEWLRSSRVRQQVRRWRRSRGRQRAAVYDFKMRLLEFGFGEFEAASATDERARRFEAFCERNAFWLHDYAHFRALKEREHWHSWETWPAPLRQRDPDALARAAASARSRVRFLQYVQWVAAEQWDEVRTHARRRGVLLKGDVPFVCSRDSADVWAHQDLFDLGSSAGAPPDEFSASGQAWGLPLCDWVAMRRSGYHWWRQRVRHARALYDLFRVDHVVGLYRTYAIPVRDGGTSGFVPPEEDAQRTQGRELMSAILEEADDATGVVVEDLGTVPQWVRDSLMQLGIPGYKVFRWEKHDGAYIDPRSYPVLSVATTGTHDTTPLETWWHELSGHERAAVARCLGVEHHGAAAALTSLEVHLALLRRLYDAGSLLTILPIQDLFGWTERINTPATTHRRNWTYRLPVETNALDRMPEIVERMRTIREMINQTGRHTPGAG